MKSEPPAVMVTTGRVDDGDASDDDDDVDLKTLAMRTARNADNERRAGDADAGSDDGNGDGDGDADETKRYAHHISAKTRALAPSTTGSSATADPDAPGLRYFSG